MLRALQSAVARAAAAAAVAAGEAARAARPLLPRSATWPALHLETAAVARHAVLLVLRASGLRAEALLRLAWEQRAAAQRRPPLLPLQGLMSATRRPRPYKHAGGMGGRGRGQEKLGGRGELGPDGARAQPCSCLSPLLDQLLHGIAQAVDKDSSVFRSQGNVAFEGADRRHGAAGCVELPEARSAPESGVKCLLRTLLLTPCSSRPVAAADHSAHSDKSVVQSPNAEA